MQSQLFKAQTSRRRRRRRRRHLQHSFALRFTPVTPILSSHSTGSNLLTGNGRLTASPIFSSRKQREFIPDNKKDDSYWDRRRRNNEAAKRFVHYRPLYRL
jgi:hypothetical protein